jgi:hypothetical protein
MSDGEFGLISDSSLRRKIAQLQKVEEECFRSRCRFRFYTYLGAVFAFYRRLRRNNEVKDSVRRMADLFDSCENQYGHPIRIIIDASSQADGKTKSRWTRALRFCWHERERWANLQTFLRENGGPAGCASKFADLNPKSPGGYVRVGGENRIPKIPLFVSKSMVDRHGRIGWN